jgi:hypothetical protein
MKAREKPTKTGSQLEDLLFQRLRAAEIAFTGVSVRRLKGSKPGSPNWRAIFAGVDFSSTEVAAAITSGLSSAYDLSMTRRTDTLPIPGRSPAVRRLARQHTSRYAQRLSLRKGK